MQCTVIVAPNRSVTLAADTVLKPGANYIVDRAAIDRWLKQAPDNWRSVAVIDGGSPARAAIDLTKIFPGLKLIRRG